MCLCSASFLNLSQGTEEETIMFLEDSMIAERVEIDENGGKSPLLRNLYQVFIPGSWETGTGEYWRE